MSKSSFKELIVWQKAMSLAVTIHRFTKTFPSEERYGLTQQLRKAAVSVPSNIAEGRGRGTPRDYRHFLLAARGSLCEVQTQVLLAVEFEYASAPSAEAITAGAEEVIRLLNGLIKYVTAACAIPYSPLATRYSPKRTR